MSLEREKNPFCNIFKQTMSAAYCLSKVVVAAHGKQYEVPLKPMPVIPHGAAIGGSPANRWTQKYYPKTEDQSILCSLSAPTLCFCRPSTKTLSSDFKCHVQGRGTAKRRLYGQTRFLNHSLVQLAGRVCFWGQDTIWIDFSYNSSKQTLHA